MCGIWSADPIVRQVKRVWSFVENRDGPALRTGPFSLYSFPICQKSGMAAIFRKILMLPFSLIRFVKQRFPALSNRYRIPSVVLIGSDC